MASDKKLVTLTVEGLVKELKENPSKRFSKSDYMTLVYAVLSDRGFKAKKYVLKNNELTEVDSDINAAMAKLFDKLLKHAGMTDAVERAAVVESFEFSPKDVEWVADAVDTAMHIYSECDKSMRIFRDQMVQLTLKKFYRTGKHEGKASYKKSVLDRTSMKAKT